MRVLFIMMFFFSFQGFAQTGEQTFPKNWCSDDSDYCSPGMKKIWNDLNASDMGPDWSLGAQVYSGVCYHDSSGYNNSHPHYGGFLIDQVIEGEKEEYTLDGRFHFFAPENPYIDVTVEEARKNWKKEKDLRIEILPTYAYYNSFPGAEFPPRYWLRRGEKPGQLLMAVYFGQFHIALCDLQVNEL